MKQSRTLLKHTISSRAW